MGQRGLGNGLEVGKGGSCAQLGEAAESAGTCAVQHIRQQELELPAERCRRASPRQVAGQNRQVVSTDPKQ